MTLLAALALSVVTVVVGYQIYRNSREQGYIRLGRNLTQTVVHIIDGDSLDRYLSGGVTDEVYENTLWLMRTIRKTNAIQYLYVVRLSGNTGWRFVYDTDEDPVKLGTFDPFDENYPEFREQALAGRVDPIISRTKWGWLLSVYEPVHNSAGKLVGYVGADFSMDGIVAERRSYLLRLISITLLITLVFAALHILLIQKTIILPINTMAKAADKYIAPAAAKVAADGDGQTIEGAASGDSPQSPQICGLCGGESHSVESPPSSIAALDIRTNDELESLAEAMKSMEQRINLAIIELQKAEEFAQSASRAKTAFLAQMSHELRTPINVIMGMARAMLYEAGNQEKVIRTLKQILVSSQQLLTILNDILDISNIESGKPALLRDAFSISDVCRSLNDLAYLQCNAKGLSFFPGTCQTDVLVWGDRVRLMQVAGNILNNAVKFTGKGGEIRFAVELQEQTGDKVRIRFTVSDTGIGISPEQQERLFQAFIPVDREVSIKYGGIGVKLSICKSIIEMMGGSIQVKSEAGKGSVFSFEISFDKAGTKNKGALAESLPAVKQTVNLLGKKILVVDDVTVNRAVVGIALKGTGADMLEAADGREALEIVTKRAEEIDLILMDISMPNMDGYEAARAIRALDTDWARSIPIIALTAHTYQEDVNAALEAGMDFHLGKPLNFDIFLATMERYLVNGQAEVPAGA
jgi:signal transduction histidine kinase/ActR/RegA family two-component response regulator